MESPSPQGGVGLSILKAFARNSVKYPFLHKRAMFATPSPMRVDVKYHKNYFTMNCIKYLDLHQKSCMAPAAQGGGMAVI